MEAQAPAKKQRTAAQEQAFKAMVEARDRKAYERVRAAAAESEASAAQPAEEPAAEPAAAAADVDDMDVESAPAPVARQQQVAQQQVAQHQQQAEFSAPAAHAAEDEEEEFEMVDVDDLMQQLHNTRDELFSLKEQFGQLQSGHRDLNDAFQQHGVRRKQDYQFI